MQRYRFSWKEGQPGVMAPVDDGTWVRFADAAELDEKARALAAACLAYDAVLRNAANDPEKLTSVRSAAGEDLDQLYVHWLRLAREIAGLPPPNIPPQNPQPG